MSLSTKRSFDVHYLNAFQNKSGEVIFVICFLYFHLQVRPFGPHFIVRVSSAENFEEKLSNAYKELGISPEDYLPINYRVENELM